jgi:anti-anti-sigma regulatory factor
MDAEYFKLTADRAAALKTMVGALESDDSWIDAIRQEMVRELPKELLPPDDEAWAESMQESFARLRTAADSLDLSAYLSAQRERIGEMAAAGLPLRTIARATSDLRDPVVEHLRRSISDVNGQRAAVDALDYILRESLIVSGEVYAAEREDKVEDEFRNLIRRLSTPVIQVWDEIQVLPLIGVIDSTRARQMTEQLLERIVSDQARVVIMDITGVPTVDTAVADHILKTAKAAGLVGARAILVGISPQVAQTLVRLGVSLGDVETYADMRSGLEHALRSLGYVVERRAV